MPNARPFNEKDLITATNGSPKYLGTIVSSGGVVNNATTATPFNSPGLGGVASPNTGPASLQGTLAGKTLLLQPTAVGSILPATNPSVTINTPPTNLVLAQQAVTPPVSGTSPGPALNFAGERVVVIMMPDEGWLQWLPLSGAGNLHVFEMR